MDVRGKRWFVSLISHILMKGSSVFFVEEGRFVRNEHARVVGGINEWVYEEARDFVILMLMNGISYRSSET